ncbi:acyltransferase family protein [Nocardioides sp. Soil796]|uniref:acyltransferase family protein n=1 Tax=Nocardioides sp. Soil796 TaxID=1736412 RepID=UPI000A71CD7F|nr:acyltransferase family protein [Nocardioides sp. Soil796]
MTLIADGLKVDPNDSPDRADGPKRRAGRNDTTKAAKGNSRIRRDIEGLRAVATFLVLPYHAGLMLFPGGFVGVDVFFVISGFVITGQLMKEVDRTGRVGLLGFYARRAKRLLPAASVVLGATAVMTWLWVPKIRWETTGGDIVASALYFVNWRLADRSVDYLAEDITPSAVQHYWSLSVEEQFYFVWPILLLGAVVLAARLGVRRKPALLVGLALVALPSFAWAVHQSFFASERAYFITTTRMWEFTIGAFVAILATRLDRIPKGLAIVLAWAGLGMILLAGRIYTSEITWPGYYAVLPTVGAGLMIAAGVAAGPKGPVAILGNRFMLFIGYLTYSLYLWHWPLLIVAREHFGGISVLTGLVIVTASVIPAWLTFHLVENPLRNSKFVGNTKVSLSLGVNCTLIAVVAGLMLVALFGKAAGPTIDPANVKGSMALSASSPKDDPAGEPVDSVQGGITPNPLEAPKDVPDLYAEGCQVDSDVAEVATCEYGAADAKTTIAIVGDSKAAQWVPAFQVLAKTHDWRIVTYTKSACQFSTATSVLDGEPYDTCREWGGDVLDRLTGDEKPDVVVTAGQRDSALTGDGDDMSEDTMQAGLEDAWTQLRDAGIEVVVLADTPQTGSDVYACVSEHQDDLTRCTYDRDHGVEASGVGVQKAAADELGAVDISPGAASDSGAGDTGLYFLDLVDAICPTDECAPVIGNVLVYRQGSHITKTYIETLAPRVEEALAKAGVR